MDSFDSSNASKSTGGLYDVTKRQSNADVASNSSGGISTLVNANVWGDASSNTGTIGGTANLHGSLYNNFSTTIPTVGPPPAVVYTNLGPITNPVAPVTLVGGTVTSPQNYKITKLNISSAVNKLILAPSAPGVASVRMW